MNSKATRLWNAWRSDSAIEQFAEAWIADPEDGWSDEDQQLAQWSETNPDRALTVMFAIMQLTDDKKVLGILGAGQLENFLGIHGEKYVEVFHLLAVRHQSLREVLNEVWQGAMPVYVWHQIEILKQRPQL